MEPANLDVAHSWSIHETMTTVMSADHIRTWGMAFTVPPFCVPITRKSGRQRLEYLESLFNNVLVLFLSIGAMDNKSEGSSFAEPLESLSFLQVSFNARNLDPTPIIVEARGVWSTRRANWDCSKWRKSQKRIKNEARPSVPTVVNIHHRRRFTRNPEWRVSISDLNMTENVFRHGATVDGLSCNCLCVRVVVSRLSELWIQIFT